MSPPKADAASVAAAVSGYERVIVGNRFSSSRPQTESVWQPIRSLSPALTARAGTCTVKASPALA